MHFRAAFGFLSLVLVGYRVASQEVLASEGAWRGRYDAVVLVGGAARTLKQLDATCRVDDAALAEHQTHLEIETARLDVSRGRQDIATNVTSKFARFIVGADFSEARKCVSERRIVCRAGGVEQIVTGRLLSCERFVPRSRVGARRQSATDALIDRGNRFHDQYAIDARISALVQGYPALAHSFTVGSSVEGAPITALRISTTPRTNDAAKPEIVLIGVHHAREWISAEVPLGIAELLCVLYYANARVRALVDAVEFVIIPVINPDGYVHSHATSRYWRKNRRVNSDSTIGVDLNRNYPTYWGSEDGASATPNDDTYYGTAAGSEPETQAFMAMMRDTSVVSKVSFFVSYHNYGEEVLYPYGNADRNMSPINDLLHNFSTHLATVVMPASPSGHAYNAYKASGLYPVSGDTVDWVHANFHNVVALTIELRPGLVDCCGFVLPTEKLNETIMENAAAAFFAAEYVVASAAVPGAGTYWWLSAGAAGRFDASRVAPVDADANGVPDWFDRCHGSGLVTVANAFPTTSATNLTRFEWPPMGVVNAVTALSGDSCANGVAAAYSVLGPTPGISRWLRMTLIPAPSAAAASATTAVGSLLQASDCAVTSSNTNLLRAALRVRVEAAFTAWRGTAPPASLVIEVRNASWQRSLVRINCMVDFRLSELQVPGATDLFSVDAVFGAVYAAGRTGNFTGFTDESSHVQDVAFAADPFLSSGNPTFPSAISTAAPPAAPPGGASSTTEAAPPSNPTGTTASPAINGAFVSPSFSIALAVSLLLATVHGLA